MRPILKCLLPTLAVALGLSACGSSSHGQASSSSTAPTATGSSTATTTLLVKTASNATLGATVLSDSRGLTLYRLSGEQDGKFICTSASCLHVWHPVTAPAAGTPTGSVGSLGTVRRPDGSEQVTYEGAPLYTFTGDRLPGEANGQGLKDVGTWSAVTVGASTPATKTAPASEPASSQSGGAGY